MTLPTIDPSIHAFCLRRMVTQGREHGIQRPPSVNRNSRFFGNLVPGETSSSVEAPMADTTRCLRCGADNLDYGRLNCWGGMGFLSWRKVPFAVFGIREPVSAYACRKCGHIELALDKVKTAG
jgi:ribosomal protein L40E